MKKLPLTAFILFAFAFVLFYLQNDTNIEKPKQIKPHNELTKSKKEEIKKELINIPFPYFEESDLNDSRSVISLNDIVGKKMMITVWATWCPTCYAEHSFLNKLNKDGVTLSGINYKDSPKKSLKWLESNHNPYIFVVNDEKGSLGDKLNVYGAPETFFVNSKGIIKYRHTGALNEEIWNEKLYFVYADMK